MERLTQLVTTSFAQSRTGSHDKYISTSSSSACPMSFDVASSLSAADPPRNCDIHISTAGRNTLGRDVDVEGASSGSRTPDDTDEGDTMRSQLSAFTGSTYTSCHCDNSNQCTLSRKKDPRHFRLLIEEGLSDFNSIW